MAEVWITKAVILTLLFIIPIVFATIPLKLFAFLSRRSGNLNRESSIFSSLNACAGGVFLATCFLHLLPEVSEGFTELWNAQNWGDLEFPLASFIMVASMFTVLIFEHVILLLCKRRNISQFRILPVHEKTSAICQSQVLPVPTERSPLLNKAQYGSNIDRTDSINNAIQQTTLMKVQQQCIHVTQVSTNESKNYSHMANSLTNESKDTSHVTQSSTNENRDVTCHSFEELPFASIMLFIALSLHTVFEGLAIGLLAGTGEIWRLFLAIALHKSAISFSIGLRAAQDFQKKKRKAYVLIMIFAILCPTGGLIGTIIKETSVDSLALELVDLICQAVATGTFLQVTFFEILCKEISGDRALLGTLCSMIGFCFMTVVIYFFPA